MTAPRTILLCLLMSVTLCSGVLARAVVRADRDGEISVSTSVRNPVIFEVGRLGLPWRMIHDATHEGAKLKWTAVAGRTYEVWERDDFVRAQLRAAGEAPDRLRERGRSLAGLTADTIRKVQKRRASGDSERLATTEMMLSRAMCLLLGVRIRIEAGTGMKVWPQCDIPLSAEASAGDRQAVLRFAGFTVPDNWAVRSVRRRANPATAEAVLLIPGHSAFYTGRYPVTAHFEVQFGRTVFRASETAEVELVHPLEREARIRTVSENEIEFIVRLRSLAPIRGIRTELQLPEGWTGEIPARSFDIHSERTIVYRIRRPAAEPDGLRIVGAVFRIGNYATSKRLITDHYMRLGESMSVTGFRVVRSEDPPVLCMENGVPCRRIPASGRVGFDVSENFLPGDQTIVSVDNSSDCAEAISIEYRAADGSVRVAEAKKVVRKGDIYRHTFVLRDAVFNGSLADGADFAVLSKLESLALFGAGVSRFGG